MELGATRWTELDRRAAPIVVVPVGSCEQHGPHLPLHTDTIVAIALARELVDRRDDCVLAPAIGVSASGEHQGFPGTLSIGTEIMAGVVIELCRSAGWARAIVLVNGHGGNAEALRRAEAVLRAEARELLVWSPRTGRPADDAHAGFTETSLVLALAPGEVDLAAAVAGPVPPLADLVRHGVRPLSPSGVLGDPAGASAAEGVRLVAELVDDLVAAVTARFG